ncbi:tetratricopeptide repeat protein [Burkholderia gladioli]|uniref:tetratricopeptide repeat protein n=1 Tax=Burkholderia TaxID=32008 RepID=UPI0020375482|nr:tetratricopeptide repeat protein [Burkholderia glumae]MCM2480649.1 sel1 repeat family protein [Burkholderia glumae]MCM2509212.1 sel1 repeat family protein [Burkholderia glumae]
MITHENFSPFVRSAHQYIKASPHHYSPALAQVREEVSNALQFPKDENVRRRLLEQRPIPIDSALCERIAAHFMQFGVRLPIHAWKWPLPDGMSLTVSERLAIWSEAIKYARQHHSLDGMWLDGFVSVEPYIKPAGNGHWYVCNRSPVPFRLCAAVLGTGRVTQRLADNSIADDARPRRDEDQAFHKALVANWKGESSVAFALFRVSADAGHPQAAFNVAWMLEEGQGVVQDLGEAMQQYQIAADRGVAMAHHNLGGIFLHGTAIASKNIKQAIAHFELAAEQGVAASWGCLGSIYLHGNGVPADRHKAIELLKHGVVNGDDHSMNAYAALLDEKNGGISTPETFALYRSAARNARQWNHALPIFNLGLCYMNGNGVAKNLRAARRLFRIAANAGDTDAALNLGYLHLHGMGTPPDLDEALAWIQLAASMDNPGALNMLGSIYLTGKWTTPNYAEAVQLFRRAEALGSLDATVNLAQCSAHGLGVKRNVPLALSLLDHAETQGNTSAPKLRAQWIAERNAIAFPAKSPAPGQA